MNMSGQGYRCSAGETFDSIALTVYGDEKYSCELLCANPLLCRVTVFKGSEIVALPVVELPDSEAEYSDMPATAPWKE